MSDHLSAETISALVSDELAENEHGAAQAHINQCLDCAKLAVNEWLLKAQTAKSGRRYEATAEFRDRIAKLAAQETITSKDRKTGVRNAGLHEASPQTRGGISRMAGWVAAAVLVAALGAWSLVQYGENRLGAARNAETAAITEACDLHIATLASSQPPQVLSSDRHTVKPWFQGKLPFSFNIPETLPAGATLDGANLAYLNNHPVAQLLFSIGRHRVSVFVEQKSGAGGSNQIASSHSGFQVAAFSTADLDVVAVSDVDATRLQALADSLKAAQSR